MTIPGFTSEDFAVFDIPGLEPRMSALIERVRPKLARIGEEIAPYLSALCGEPMYPHVAKHARRTVYPPNDTWVAWANNKRGYKAHPHFQVGLWSSHLFIQFAVIYESPNKTVFARHLAEKLPEIMASVPAHYYWSVDHTQPAVTPHSEMTQEKLLGVADRLLKVKKAEALCGLTLYPGEDAVSDGGVLLRTIESVFETLLPLYRISF